MAEVGSDMDYDVEGANHEEENQTIVTFEIPGQAEDYTFNFDDDTIPENSDTAHKGFTITPNVNYKCLRSVAAFALPVAAMALPQPPIYLSFT